MTFYMYMAALLCLLALILPWERTKLANRVYATLAFGLFGFVAAIRSPTVGADTQQYYDYYPIIGSLNWADSGELRYEAGYFFLNKIAFLMSQSPQVFIAATSLFVLSVLGWFIGKYSPSAVLSALLFLFLQGYAMILTALRQSLAMAVFLLFIPQLLRQRYLTFAVGVALAAQFHSSAWVLLVLIPVVHMRVDFRTTVGYLVAAGVFFLFNRELLARAVSGAGQYSDYLDAYETSGAKLGVLLMMGFYVALLLVVTHYSSPGDEEKVGENRVTQLFLHASWMLVPVMSLAYGSNAYLRLENYYIPFLVVVIPLALRRVEDRFERQMVTALFLVVCLLYYATITLMRPEWYKVTPFVSEYF